jgi:hypothetical protein
MNTPLQENKRVKPGFGLYNWKTGLLTFSICLGKQRTFPKALVHNLRSLRTLHLNDQKGKNKQKSNIKSKSRRINSSKIHSCHWFQAWPKNMKMDYLPCSPSLRPSSAQSHFIRSMQMAVLFSLTLSITSVACNRQCSHIWKFLKPVVVGVKSNYRYSGFNFKVINISRWYDGLTPVYILNVRVDKNGVIAVNTKFGYLVNVPPMAPNSPHSLRGMCSSSRPWSRHSSTQHNSTP